MGCKKFMLNIFDTHPDFICCSPAFGLILGKFRYDAKNYFRQHRGRGFIFGFMYGYIPNDYHGKPKEPQEEF